MKVLERGYVERRKRRLRAFEFTGGNEYMRNYLREVLLFNAALSLLSDGVALRLDHGAGRQKQRRRGVASVGVCCTLGLARRWRAGTRRVCSTEQCGLRGEQCGRVRGIRAEGAGDWIGLDWGAMDSGFGAS
ncbi:hypothetical protein FGB62_44g140 [Gracilaria domingensis]|nr:hypothetical protein FGB62_44g140 [Gracilaria domingensis]